MTDPERTTITVLTTQLEALRERLGPELADDELYSAAAIAVLLYIGGRSPVSGPPSPWAAHPERPVGL